MDTPADIGQYSEFAVDTRTPWGHSHGRIHAWRVGDPTNPRKLLFMHGIGITLSTWRRCLPRLAECADCVAVDLLGYGRSTAGAGADVTMAGQAGVVPAVLDHFGWRRAVLVGHSMGGGVALGAALAYPRRVAGLVLVASISYPQTLPFFMLLMHLPFAAPAMALLAQAANRLGLGQYVGARWTWDPEAGLDYIQALARPDTARTFADAARDLVPSRYRTYGPRYPNLGKPVLVIHGDRDWIVPGEGARRLDEELPDSRLVWVRGADHMPQESAAPLVAGAIEEFLSQRFPDGLERVAPPGDAR